VISKSIQVPEKFRPRSSSVYPISHQGRLPPHIPHQYPKTVLSTEEKGKLAWPKLRFDQFVTKTKANFAVGDYVTMVSIPHQESARPVAYLLTYIHELWYSVTYDEALLEPNVLCCEYLLKANPNLRPFNMAPQRMRKLTSTEMQNVLVHHQSLQNSSLSGS